MSETTKESTQVRSRTTLKAAIAVGAAVVLALVLGLFIKHSSGAGGSQQRASWKVAKGPLDIVINETGELQAADSIRVVPQIRGRATIVELVDEGARVKQGDVVCKLDASDLEQQESTQAIDVENASASLVKAQEEKKIQELQNQVDISKAELAVQNAQMELDKYGMVVLNADGYLDKSVYGETRPQTAAVDPAADPVAAVAADADTVKTATDASRDGASADVERGEAYQAFQDAEMAIDRAKTNLEKAQTDFANMDQLLDKGFVTKNDYIDDQLKVVEGERQLESALLSHYILRTYDYPKKTAQLKSDLKKAQDQLEQTQLSARSQMTQRDAAITQAQAVYEMRQRYLDDTRERLASTTITAPSDGFVLYGDERRPWEKDDIKVGGTAYEGRTLITLPSVENMIAATKVQEKDVYKVKAGQPAVVTVPALPGLSLEGRVSRISNVASAGNRWMASSETKTFDVEVVLKASDPRMKPGMSCQAGILISTIPDCLYAPVNCVFHQDNKDTCNILSRGNVISTQVTTGESNDIYVQYPQRPQGGRRDPSCTTSRPAR